MDDRQLQRMIRMALEAEQLEAGERLRLSGTPRDLRPAFVQSPGRRWRSAVAIVASIGLLAGALTIPRMLTVPSTGGAPVPEFAASPHNTQLIERSTELDEVAARALAIFKGMVNRSEEPTMVLAVFRDQADACDCVTLQEADFGDRELDKISRAELIAEAMKTRCTQESSLVLVLALDGPRSALPETDDQARALAQCVTARDGCETNPACFATHARECLDGQVAVVAEIGPR